MARARAKKSAEKGKGKKNDTSPSPIRKTKSVDEVTGILVLNVLSTILEGPRSVEEDLNDVTEIIPPPLMEDRI